MNSLKVPENGLTLHGTSNNDANIPPQAFAITLNDNIIEDMIKCVQGGNDIELVLGTKPTFVYSHRAYPLSPSTADSDPYDLYLTRPFESTRDAQKLPHAGSLFEKPKITIPSITVHAEKSDKEAEARTKISKRSKESSPSRLDPGLEGLRSGLQAAQDGREKAVIGSLPSKKAGPKKGKLLSGYNSAPRSIPASPAVRSVASPSSPAVSALQQTLERAKEQRVTLVHELAVQDRTLEYLRKKWTGKEEDLRPTLEKVADCLGNSKNWAMKKAHWKELDVWNYEYDTQELRQKAIDNAVRHYDKQRLSASEPEWQKLLHKDERGQGKSLSRLQANLAKGPAQSTTSKKSDSGSVKDDSSVDGDKPRVGGHSMSRAGSNPLPPKPKKASGGDTQAKRLLGKSKAKTMVPKTSPVKAKATGTKANGGRILSKEIIENSDSSGDEALPVKPKPVAKPKESVIAKPRPMVKQPVKQQRQTKKRPREEDDSSSSSSSPLSKRLKPKQPLPTSSSTSRLKHRPSDASQNSRGTATTSSSLKSKNTSPAKSSPLASSPPTNASDLETEAPPAPVVSKKRKAEVHSKPGTSKRPAVALSTETVNKAHKFKLYYEKYEALHWEIAKLDNPPQTKLHDLKEMRSRLASMKEEIYQECGPDRNRR